ncbi:diaminopimelate epimerase [Helicobacter sp. 13S00477-4]|uniref:diaminopimelate epimerase n=1 Tax=Helicobacter sp. 13S00477-4 TaxID=1905759 RepID=UPI000BA69782|nr:diaminopimelate epimerase [Helicobacter sp. 13S00477-4]PAF51646.1 diaminopimelate epimerase [Helicobacter sp. 13S00477-4]
MVLHKYSGSGNDFLISHSFKKDSRSELAKKLCDRHSGFGADGFVVLLPHTKYAYEWEFYNSDGSGANMCGNASRCAAHYAYSQGLAPAKHTFLTQAGEVKVSVMGEVVLSDIGTYQIIKKMNLKEKEYGGDWYLIDTGVPHLVHFVDNAEKIPKNKTHFLKEMRLHYNANVNIAYIQDKENIFLSTYERGVEGITLACGTGMAAVFVIGNLYYNINPKATLIPLSQDKLTLSFEGKNILYEGRVQRIGICIPFQNKYE